MKLYIILLDLIECREYRHLRYVLQFLRNRESFLIQTILNHQPVLCKAGFLLRFRYCPGKNAMFHETQFQPDHH